MNQAGVPMRKNFAIVAALWLLCAVSLPVACADRIPISEAPPRPSAVRRERYQIPSSTYLAASAGVVALAMTISLIALRSVRKKQ